MSRRSTMGYARSWLSIPGLALAMTACSGDASDVDPGSSDPVEVDETQQPLSPADVPIASRGNSVLLIVLDDVGVEATDLYPARYRPATTPPAVAMPNLRSLAKKGVMFTNAWANPSCSPTRASIFTGRHAFRHGVGVAVHDLPGGGTSPQLSPNEVGLPRALSARNPNNRLLAHIGKWHLSTQAGDPNAFGWPYFAGPHPNTDGGVNYFKWFKIRNGKQVHNPPYATLDQIDETVGQIESAKTASRPYFITLQLNAPHTPLHKVPSELHPQQDAHSSLPHTERATANHRAYYEMMLESVDLAIKRIVDHVDLTTTTVFVMADNGTPENIIAAPFTNTQAKTSMYQGGVRVPLFAFGANVTNPNASAARFEERLVQSVDLFPTILNLAGIAMRDVVPAGTKIDGRSLVPYLRNDAGAVVRHFAYSELFDERYDLRPRRTVRNWKYKLIVQMDGKKELYNLLGDPNERDNLLRVGRALTAEEQTHKGRLEQEMARLLASR